MLPPGRQTGDGERKTHRFVRQPLVRDDDFLVRPQTRLDPSGLPLPEDDVPFAISAADPLAIGREPYLTRVSRDGVPGEALVPGLAEVVRAVHQDLVVQALCGEVLL